MFDFCQGLELQSNKILRRLKHGVGGLKLLPAPTFAVPEPRKPYCGRKEAKKKVEAQAKQKKVCVEAECLQPAYKSVQPMKEVNVEFLTSFTTPVKEKADLDSDCSLLIQTSEKSTAETADSSTYLQKPFENQCTSDTETAFLSRRLISSDRGKVISESRDTSLDASEPKSRSDMRSTQHRSNSRSQTQRSCGEEDSDLESDCAAADFSFFNNYEAHERQNPYELRQLFDKVNRHFLPKVRNPQVARLMMESSHPIPICYQALTHVFQAVEVALFRLTESRQPCSYLKIKEQVLKDTRK